MRIIRNVGYIQPRDCWGCVHIGGTALQVGVGWRDRALWRLELFTDRRRFRWSWWPS
jgi:hypothetical protein